MAWRGKRSTERSSIDTLRQKAYASLEKQVCQVKRGIVIYCGKPL